MSDQGNRRGKQFVREVPERSGLRWRAADPAGDIQRHAARHQSPQGSKTMPTEVKTGQQWSIWVPGRRQWLLTTVIRRQDGQATLKFDASYGVGTGHDEQQADEFTMLSASNLFRFVGQRT